MPDSLRPTPLESPVICFNVNPAVEKTCVVSDFEIGHVNRTSSFVSSPSGKAATVSRTIGNLGLDSIQVGPLAGRVGEEFVELLSEENLRGEWVWVPGDTRTNITVVSEVDRVDTIINESGPVLTPADWKALSRAIELHARAGVPVCVSGSIPAGVTPENLTDLLSSLRAKNIPVFVDASGWALSAMLDATPWCAKFNHHEAEGLLSRTLGSVSEVAQAAREIVDRVQGIVIITMGAEGAVLANKSGQVFHVVPPRIDAASGVGSGDTFLGALVVGLYGLGYADVDAVVFASGAGALNATSTRQGIVDMDSVLRLAEECGVQELSPAEKGA